MWLHFSVTLLSPTGEEGWVSLAGRRVGAGVGGDSRLGGGGQAEGEVALRGAEEAQ